MTANPQVPFDEIEPHSIFKSQTDLQLVDAVKARDQLAMMAIYDRYYSVVVAVAFRVLGNSSSAEDVCQEVFLQLWQYPGKFDPERGVLAAWLAVIARHRAIDICRHFRSETDIRDGSRCSDDNCARGRIEECLDVEKVRNALQSLPEAQRQTFELSFFQQLSHQEISERMNAPLGTVKSRLRLGLKTLRTVLCKEKLRQAVVKGNNGSAAA